MHLRKLVTSVLLVFNLLSLAIAAFGQITGEVRGVVVDSSGASVGNAKVSLKSVETGEVREQTTDTEGRFAFSLLKIGKYEIRVEASGFRTGITQADVLTGEIASVRLTLEVGQVTEVVNVTDAVSLIDTENAQIQRSIEGSNVLDIPVNRNPDLFATTAPGVAPVSPNHPFLGSGSFNSNGGRGRGNNITVDGITATDVSVTGTGGPLGPLNFNAIREVKVITNNFSAEYGRNSSAQVLYITKGGTNQLRGDFFNYFQNDKLNARPFFDTTGKPNVVRQNNWGFVLGGPVYLPNLYDGRNRAFWLVTYEGLKARGASKPRIASVPTPEMLAQVTDPASKAILDMYKLPAAATVSGGVGQVPQSAPSTADTYQFSVRGDYNLSSNDTLWARYSQFRSTAESEGNTFIGTNLAGFGAGSTNFPRQATLAEAHTFSPTMVNEFRFGFGRSEPAFPIQGDVLGPRIIFADGSIDSFGPWEGLPQGRSQNTYQFTNNFSWTRGAHNLKMGFEYYYLHADSFFDALVRPVLTFTSWEAFAQGRPALYQQRFGNSVRANRVHNQFAFFQDDWKVSRSLTLNLGVRVERAQGPTEKEGRLSNLNLDCKDPVGGGGTGRWGCFQLGGASFGTNVNWAPRVGFAWTPFGDQKTVIRGGYGIAYDFIYMNPITNQRFLPPLMPTVAASGATLVGNNSLERILAGTSDLQAQGQAAVGQFSPTQLNFGNVTPAIDLGLRNPQVHQWNLGLQRDLKGFVLKASYVGTKGNYLQRSRPINLPADPRLAPATSLADEAARLNDFRAGVTAMSGNAARFSNRIDPRFNEITLVDSSANSNYHSFQFEAQRRIGSEFLMLAAYTWGKSIDDSSDALSVLVGDSAVQQNPNYLRGDRAPSQFDLRHRLVITHLWEPKWGAGASGFKRHLLHGWGFAGITSFQSGFPVTLLAGPRLGISSISLVGTTAPVRPNISGPIDFNPRPANSAGAPAGLNNDPVQPISDYAASLGLSQPLLGNFGNMGRNVLRLNGERNFDWNIYKNFALTETVKFQFRAEFYNIFNNTSFLEVERNIADPIFGQYTSVSQNARWIQLGARLVF